MLHLELHDDKTGQRFELGMVGDFAQAVSNDMKTVQFTSKVFSTKGIVDQSQIDKEIRFAFDRVIQSIKDNR